jgi:FkbM family methyltransferase
MIPVRILNYIGYRAIEIAQRMDNIGKYPPEEHARYLKEDPYDMKRVTYPLNSDSLVVDIGGLTGDWAARIYCLYSCNIDIYEPHPVLSEQARLNFATNPKVNVYGYGLSDQWGMMTLYGDQHASSLYPNESGDKHQVSIEKASTEFNKKYGDKQIALLKLNVEGAEYGIMPDLLNNYDIKNITDIQIQFHTNVKNHEKKRDKIREQLAKTHYCSWNYDWIFENWTLITK